MGLIDRRRATMSSASASASGGSSSSRTMCHILTLVLFGLLWIVGWQHGTQMSSPIQSRYYSSSSTSSSSSTETYSTKALKAPVWEAQEDALTLTGELIGEVVNELEKVREVITENSNDASKKNRGGSEATLATMASGSDKAQLLQPVGRSLHSLLLHSVSRVSRFEFSAVGIVSVQLRRQQGDAVHSCAWVSRASSEMAASLAASNHSSVAWASSTQRYVNESLDSDYDVTVVRCSFEDPVGANAEGGVLLLNVTTSRSFEFVPVFQESPEELNSIPFEGPFRYDYAFCSPPVFSKNMSAKHVEEWFLYHQSLWHGNKVHYFIYDAGHISASAGLRGVFQPLIDAGSVTVVDLKEALRFGLPQHGHQLAINDCLQRCRFIANWAFFWDFDEYFQLLDQRLSSTDELLQMYDGKPWISLGSMLWSRTYCDVEAADGGWDIERMNFRLGFPTCSDENRANFCHGIEGQRKWIANPREVFLGTVFRTLDPEWNGEILNASVARLNHFKDLVLAHSSTNCWISKNVGEMDASTAVDGWWWKDTGLAESAREARLRLNSTAAAAVSTADENLKI